MTDSDQKAARISAAPPTQVAMQMWAANTAYVFTQRHLSILGELAKGYSNKEIGKALILSPETVKHHLKSIFSKLCVSTREDAVAEARRQSLIPYGDKEQTLFQPRR